MSTTTTPEWAATSSAYRTYLAAAQRCAQAFQKGTAMQYTVTEETVEKYRRTITQFRVTPVGDAPPLYGNHAYPACAVAEIHAALLSALPAHYSVTRRAYRGGPNNGEYYWHVSRQDRHDPISFSRNFLESEGLDRIVEVASRSARQHAVGAGARSAQAEAEEILREATEARRAELTAQKGPLATPRQIDYIMSLLAKREHHGDDDGFIFDGPTTRAQVAEMSQAEASTYIDSLTGNY